MDTKKYSITAFVVAMIFWFVDAAIHYFVYSEPQFEIIPSNFNELWMRVTIVTLLLTIGIYADWTTRRLIMKERQIEALRVYTSMLRASRHILNNLLNQIQIIKIEAEKSKDFDQEVIKYYDAAFDEAKDLIQKLSEIENFTDESIWSSVAPVDKTKSENKTNSASV